MDRLTESRRATERTHRMLVHDMDAPNHPVTSYPPPPLIVPPTTPSTRRHTHAHAPMAAASRLPHDSEALSSLRQLSPHAQPNRCSLSTQPTMDDGTLVACGLNLRVLTDCRGR